MNHWQQAAYYKSLVVFLFNMCLCKRSAQCTFLWCAAASDDGTTIIGVGAAATALLLLIVAMLVVAASVLLAAEPADVRLACTCADSDSLIAEDTLLRASQLCRQTSQVRKLSAHKMLR
jgi:hypothetical protein